jgi:hypothetical protein
MAANAAPVHSPTEMSSAIRDLTLAVSNLRTFLQAPYAPPPPPAAPFAPPPPSTVHRRAQGTPDHPDQVPVVAIPAADVDRPANLHDSAATADGAAAARHHLRGVWRVY